MKHEWEYTRSARMHYVDNGERYLDKDGHCTHYLLEIRCCSELYEYIDSKKGYDMYHKGKKVEWGKRVKYLKIIGKGLVDGIK